LNRQGGPWWWCAAGNHVDALKTRRPQTQKVTVWRLKGGKIPALKAWRDEWAHFKGHSVIGAVNHPPAFPSEWTTYRHTHPPEVCQRSLAHTQEGCAQGVASEARKQQRTRRKQVKKKHR